jgi:plastocyanin
MKTLIIAIVVIVVILGGWYFFKHTAPVPSITPQRPGGTQSSGGNEPANSGNTVIYTDSGYSPATLTIKAGETVTFVNQSSDPMWTASNPHPIHTDYPGFDALAGTLPGQSYSFTFTKTGHWGYHNHLNASKGGAIIVE